MKKISLFGIKIVVSGGLLYAIILKIDWSQLSVSVIQGDLFYLCLGVFFGVAFNLVKFMKWHNLVKVRNHTYTYWDGAKSYMIGNALGLITPMRAGDIGRALYFDQKERPRIIGLTIIDRLIDLAIVVMLAIGGSFTLINKGFGTLVVLLSIFILFMLYSPNIMCKAFKIIIPTRFSRLNIIKGLDAFDNLDFRVITIASILSLIAFFFVILQFYYLVMAFEDITLLAIFLVTPLVTLSTIIPVSLMGLGIREGLSILLLSTYGVSASTAFSAAFLFFIINNVSISIIGIIHLSRIDVTTKKNNAYTS
ncbi:MAG: lysylphosphatidylglycerol synthase transmembrane domain-containing protein [Thermodesulfobacteriota bacterium]|nr:lysylphosphatidylglycerol synthase transmembrane domain-containing protein [Thermodesulfobacteriota bacterium]